MKLPSEETDARGALAVLSLAAALYACGAGGRAADAAATDASADEMALDTGFDAGGSATEASTEAAADSAPIDASEAAVTETGVDAGAPLACETPGLRRCDGRCVDLAADPGNCGACGVACRSLPHRGSTCSAGECDAACERGYGDCDGVEANGCESALDARANCGACGRACTAAQVCSSGACIAYEAAPPPQLIAPLSGARVARRRPELVLRLSGGAAGAAQVQLCRERVCATAVESFEVTAARVTVPSMLEPGTYFWRARTGSAGRYGAWSPVWQLRVLAREALAAAAAPGTSADFNGDGLADVAVGAPAVDRNTGEAYVYYGRREGPARVPDWRFRGTDGQQNRSAARVSTLGDVNGDGFADLLVGVPDAAFYAGRGMVFFGSAAGLAASPSWIVTSPVAGGLVSEEASAVGDANGDGFGDFVLGAIGRGGGAGTVLLYRGGGFATAPSPAQTLVAAMGTYRFGESLAWLGDTNGDGFGDLAVGAGGGGPTSLAPRSYVYSGDGAQLARVPALEYAGETIAAVGVNLAAGDFNGDGYGDLLRSAVYGAGARVTLGSMGTGLQRDAIFTQMMCAGDVGAGGDLDADGFDDALLACNDTVTVVFGGATGVSTRRATLRDGVSSAGGLLAPRVTIAGDVNGDGFDDALVGVGLYEGGRGAVFLFYGSRTGVAETPSWTASGPEPDGVFGHAIGGG